MDSQARWFTHHFIMNTTKYTSARRKRLARPAFTINALNGNVVSGNWLRNMTYKYKFSGSGRDWLVSDAERFFNRGQKFRMNKLQASARRMSKGKVSPAAHDALLSRTPFSPTQSMAHQLALVGYA